MIHARAHTHLTHRSRPNTKLANLYGYRNWETADIAMKHRILKSNTKTLCSALTWFPSFSSYYMHQQYSFIIRLSCIPILFYPLNIFSLPFLLRFFILCFGGNFNRVNNACGVITQLADFQKYFIFFPKRIFFLQCVCVQQKII